jgi:DNA-binding response OmpR family regulator
MSEERRRRPRVLVVEDNPLLARFTAIQLTQLGWDVVGPAGSVGHAVELAGAEPLDAALLDVNVAELSAAPIADVLRHRDIPFAVMTGYGPERIPPIFRDELCLYKPFRESDLKSLMAALIGDRRDSG